MTAALIGTVHALIRHVNPGLDDYLDCHKRDAPVTRSIGRRRHYDSRPAPMRDERESRGVLRGDF